MKNVTKIVFTSGCLTWVVPSKRTRNILITISICVAFIGKKIIKKENW